MSNILDKFNQNEKELWDWLVKYGYNHLPNDKSLKKAKQWQDLFKIYGKIRDLRNDIRDFPDFAKDEIAKQILLPHNIDLDEILERHFS